MTHSPLSKQERKSLQESGVTHATVIEERIGNHGTVSRLLRGKAIDEVTTIYGWWMYGEGVNDIRWDTIKAND